MPKMDFPRFDGTDLQIWLNKCEAFFQLYHIPDNKYLLQCPAGYNVCYCAGGSAATVETIQIILFQVSSYQVRQ